RRLPPRQSDPSLQSRQVMNTRSCTAALALTACLLLSQATAQEPKPAAKVSKKTQAKAVFGLDKVHDLHLTLSAKQWAKMQPAAPRFDFLPGSPGGAPRGQEKADTHRSGFGMEFPWTSGELTIDGQAFKEVGLRFKGNFTYMASSGGLKRPIK